MAHLPDSEARILVQQVEARLGALEELTGVARVAAEAAVETLVELYGEVLDRVMGYVTHTATADLLPSLTRDEVVGHVLMAHGLLPAPPELMETTSSEAEVPVTFLGRRPSAVVGQEK